MFQVVTEVVRPGRHPTCSCHGCAADELPAAFTTCCAANDALKGHAVCASRDAVAAVHRRNGGCGILE